MTRRVALIGNVGSESPPFSTENEYLNAYAANGVSVVGFNEASPAAWGELIDDLKSGVEYDFIHWTSTPSFRHQIIDRRIQKEMLALARLWNIPVVAVHLDQFDGIPEREEWVRNDLYFHGVDLFLGTQGASVDWFRQQGVNYRWLLPGVSTRWCHPGNPRPEYTSDVAFVGSWQGHYHKNSKHRHRLVRWLENTYGQRVKFWPARNQPAIRGDDLTDLYWSTKVVVGDSFMPGGPGSVPPPQTCSDRIPETLGRGGILAAPLIEGINDADGPFALPAHATWRAWDWAAAKQTIDALIGLPEADRQARRLHAIHEIKTHHSYEHRVREIFNILDDERLL